jgi:hypothetical protein
MAKENKKRPIYGSSQGPMDIEALHLLPPEEAEGLNPSPFWKRLPNWIGRTFGLTKLPEGSGFGYIYPPYYSTYNLVYGLLPIADLPKYRILYRTQPDIFGGINLIVNLATAKGFTIEYEDDDVREFLEKLVEEIELGPTLQMVTRDALNYGDGYLEIVWSEPEQEESEEEVPNDLVAFVKDEFPSLERGLKDKNTPETTVYALTELQPSVKAWRQAISRKQLYKKPDGKFYCKAQRLSKGQSKEVVAVKALDPIYMRIRADPFGAIYGYIQWLQWPPAIIDTDSMVEIKNLPTSEAYATVYGQSQLLPLVKNTDLLNLFDQDVANWIHNQAVIPLWVKGGGAPDKPYSTEQMTKLVGDWANRTAATTVFTKSDVEVSVLKGGGRDLKVDWWQKYLLERRMLALGVPPLFMGLSAAGTARTAEVQLSDFITRVQSLQNHISSQLIDRLFVPAIVAMFGEEKINKFGKPSMVWKPIIEEDRNKRLLNVDRLAVDGIIAVNEARTATGWSPFRRPGYEEYDPEYDEPQLLRIPPQLGKLGMPEKPTKGAQQLGQEGTRLNKLTPDSVQPKDKETQPQGKAPPTKQPIEPKQEEREEQRPISNGLGLPPVSFDKTAEIKNRALAITNKLFQQDLEAIIYEVDTELRMGGVLIRDIKAKYMKKADDLIAKWMPEKIAKQRKQEFHDLINSRIENYNK